MTASAEISSAEQIQQRLNDPKIAEGLNRLLDRIDTLSFAVEMVDGLVSRGEVITDSIAETVGELKGGIQSEQAQDFLEKVPQRIETSTRLTDAAGALNVEELEKSRVLKRLTEPETLESLNQLLDRLPLAAFLMESLEEFIGRGETITDNLAEILSDLNSSDHPIDPSQIASLIESLPKFREAGEKLLESDLFGKGIPTVIDAGLSMIDSGMLDEKLVSTLGKLGKQSAETYLEVSSKPVAPIGGLLATLRATKDPDVQKSVGFFFAFAKAFAKHLK